MLAQVVSSSRANVRFNGAETTQMFAEMVAEI
jgi:hypothetical protein